MNELVFIYWLGFLVTAFIVVSSIEPYDPETELLTFWVATLGFCFLWVITMPAAGLVTIATRNPPKK